MNAHCRKMLFSFHTDHDQNSVYGDMPYMAKQRIGFTLTWDKKLNKHDLLFDCSALPIL
jgi:outer membrane receptor for ferrienterochelin and colicins